MTEPNVNLVRALVAIIREVDGNHSRGVASLAETILTHPSITAWLSDHRTITEQGEEN